MKAKRKTKRIRVSDLFMTRLPPAISGRISPLLTIGSAILLSSLALIFITPLRASAPMFAMLGIVLILYALWQKADVLKRGYDTYIFKVVDYSQILPVATKRTPPSGLFLIKKREEGEDADDSIYHISISARGNLLPPIDWLIKVYVPKDMEAATYGGKKYFPIVYGYSILGEDK